MTGNLVIDLGLVAFLPMLAYSVLFWSLDRYEKEPWWLLLGMFAWGAAPAIALTFPISNWGWTWIDDSADAGTLYICVVAPASEELAKGIALVALLFFFHREIDSIVDGVLYGCLVGFGFSATEDTRYFLDAYADGGSQAVVQLTILRSYLTGLGHALFSSCIGVAVALARQRRPLPVRAVIIVGGYIQATFLHGLFNSGVAGILVVMLAGTAGLLVLINSQLRRERRWIVRELGAERRSGVIDGRQYRVLVSPARRATALLTTFLRRGPRAWWALARFYRTATELAFAKRHRRMRDDDSLTEPIRRLRASVTRQAEELVTRPAVP